MKSGRTIRLLSYNVRRCLGTDGTLSPDRIAEVIAATRADIVALQELDVGRARTSHVDQALRIAEPLGMVPHFHPAMRVMEELYGDAILTALPSRLVKADALPGLPARPKLEPRGALWVAVALGEMELQVVNTHFGLVSAERRAQAEAVLGPDWLGHPDCRDPVVLLGDFNSVPRSRAYGRLAKALSPTRRAPGIVSSPATFPSGCPIFRIDHAFTRGPVAVRALEAVRTPLTRLASDHLPLVIDLEIGPGEEEL